MQYCNLQETYICSFIYICSSSWLTDLQIFGISSAIEQWGHLSLYYAVPCPQFLKLLQRQKGEVSVLLFKKVLFLLQLGLC